MSHLAFFYYTIAYSMGLPALAVIGIAYARTHDRVLGSYLPFLLSVSVQLILVAILRYEDAALLYSSPYVSVTTRHIYFLAESTLALTLPVFCHGLSGTSHSRRRNIVFSGVFAICVGLILSPLFMSYRADTSELIALPGFYFYRVLFFLTILYSMTLLVIKFRGLASKILKRIAAVCFISTALLLWETLHCELFPVLGHSLPAIALSPLGYFVTNLVFLFYVIREYLLPKPLPAQTGTSALVFERYGISAREREIAELLSSGCANKEICRRLFISDSTVKTHVKSLYRKLGVRNRVQLVNILKGPA
jgi:DNA-binding CsgD family transcriptional regulator